MGLLMSLKTAEADVINAYFAMRLSEQKVEHTKDMAAYKARLLTVMKGQSDYHRKNSHRAENIHHRLHTLAAWMFYGTLVACASHFVWYNPILTLMSGFLPAVAAALHGILANGEFSETADVSKHMHHEIGDMVRQLEESTDEDKIRRIVIDFHNVVIREALDWKSISISINKNVPLA